MAKRPPMKPYGICVHGIWTFFDTLKEVIGHCAQAILGTEGEEQRRYAIALWHFSEGWTHINTDY